MVINCDKSVKTANLLPFIYTEIRIKYLLSVAKQKPIDLKQKFLH